MALPRNSQHGLMGARVKSSTPKYWQKRISRVHVCNAVGELAFNPNIYILNNHAGLTKLYSIIEHGQGICLSLHDNGYIYVCIVLYRNIWYIYVYSMIKFIYIVIEDNIIYFSK